MHDYSSCTGIYEDYSESNRQILAEGGGVGVQTNSEGQSALNSDIGKDT